MSFRISPEKLIGSFNLPAEVVDSHLKLAGTLQLRVILYCYRHLTEPIEPTFLANLFTVSEEDIKDALLFWSELGLLVNDAPVMSSAPATPAPVKVAPPKTPRPDRKEVARRGLESPDIAFLLNEAQKKFGRMLKQSESSVLVWLYDDLGMDASLILMVIEYAMQADRCHISYIEKVAKDWSENGVETIAAAEARIVELNNARSAWHQMRLAFGLDQRAPSEAESKLAKAAILDWKMDRDLLKKAYDICVDALGKYKVSYIKTVLTGWHKNGISSLLDLEKQSKEESKPSATPKKTGKKYDYATYDLSLMEQIINEE